MNKGKIDSNESILDKGITLRVLIHGAADLIGGIVGLIVGIILCFVFPTILLNLFLVVVSPEQEWQLSNKPLDSPADYTITFESNGLADILDFEGVDLVSVEASCHLNGGSRVALNVDGLTKFKVSGTCTQAAVLEPKMGFLSQVARFFIAPEWEMEWRSW